MLTANQGRRQSYLVVTLKPRYANLRVEEVSRIVAGEYQRSELEIEVNEEELGLYLAL